MASKDDNAIGPMRSSSTAVYDKYRGKIKESEGRAIQRTYMDQAPFSEA